MLSLFLSFSLVVGTLEWKTGAGSGSISFHVLPSRTRLFAPSPPRPHLTPGERLNFIHVLPSLPPCAIPHLTPGAGWVMKTLKHTQQKSLPPLPPTPHLHVCTSHKPSPLTPHLFFSPHKGTAEREGEGRREGG
eukprot:Sspe_Gene.71810::Locus_42646_Transcript_1_1_Confidence_1.000_Length_603::g.71810::m.71810